VIADLKANPGSRPGEIAKRLGIAPTHAQTILSKLVEEERVTKSGPQYTWAGGA
jgi:DNA-binding MarR family transcriptional regulator